MNQNKLKECKESDVIQNEENTFTFEIDETTLEKNENTRPILFYVTIFTVQLLAFCAGCPISWTSPVLPMLEARGEKDGNPLNEPINALQASLVAGFLHVGSAIGPLISGYIANKFGRKITLLCIAIPLMISYVALAFARHLNIFYAARIAAGLSFGGFLQIAPIYLSEISRKSNRGKLNCLTFFSFSLGMLSAYTIGPYVSIKWYCMFYTAPLSVFFVLYRFIPESPFYWASKGDLHRSKVTLMKLRGRRASVIEEELVEMREFSQEDDHKAIVGSRAFTICFVLVTVQVLSGIVAILAFMQTIFDAAGGTMPPSVSPVIVGTIKCIFTVFSSYIVDTNGRKIVLIVSLIGCSISLYLLGGFYFLQSTEHHSSYISWLPVASLVGYVAFFSIGLSPIPFILIGEMFPLKVKSAVSGYLNSFHFLVALVESVLFANVADSFGMAPLFWLFGAFCTVGVFFVHFYVIETKGKSFHEIQILLNNN